MKKTLLLLIAFFCSIAAAEAQMTTDNSYLRRNYEQSKTAKKAAEKKARKKTIKEKKAAEKQQQNNAKAQTKANSKEKIYINARSSSNATSSIPKLADAQYLAGAVPTTAEGIVCFERSFPHSTKSRAELYGILRDYATAKIAQTQDLDISRILSESGDTLVATICEPLYFKKKKWESDSTLIQYQYFVTFNGDTPTLRIWFISYCYEQSQSSGFNYKAEEWITDKYALSKDQYSLLKLPGKFRKKTIDYITQMLQDIEEQLGPYSTPAAHRQSLGLLSPQP